MTGSLFRKHIEQFSGHFGPMAIFKVPGAVLPVVLSSVPEAIMPFAVQLPQGLPEKSSLTFSEPDTVRITLDFFEEDGDAYVRSTEQFSERAYTLDTLKQILNDHHLTVDAIYDDWSGEPPAQDAQRWTIVARKQEDLQNGQE